MLTVKHNPTFEKHLKFWIYFKIFKKYISTMVVAKKFCLVKHFENDPKESDFKLEEETIPPIKEGG